MLTELTTHKDLILILDFGSQYAQLIARRVRENNVYSRIVPYNVSFEEVESLRPRGIILSGGPASVYQDSAPVCNKGLLELGVPILGICYGMQIGCQLLGAQVRASRGREYGRAHLVITHPSALLGHIGDSQTVWMSHGDQVSDLP